RSHPRVTVVTYQSQDYAKYLATAKYLINNTSFPFYFHKRREQIYANVWHGTPLKTMAMDIKQRGFADHKKIQRNFLFTDPFLTWLISGRNSLTRTCRMELLLKQWGWTLNTEGLLIINIFNGSFCLRIISLVLINPRMKNF